MRRYLGIAAITALLTFTCASVATLAPSSPTSPWPFADARERMEAASVTATAVLATATATPSAAPSDTATGAPTPTRSPTVTHSPAPTPTRRPAVTPAATLAPEVVPARSIYVDQNQQTMHIYENGVEIRVLPCSTGLPLDWHWTPEWSGTVGPYRGTFFAYGAYCDDAWLLFKATGDILIHSAPYTWVDGVKVYQDLDALGRRPSSHGCIRLGPEDARWLTAWNPEGVPIVISPLTRRFGP